MEKKYMELKECPFCGSELFCLEWTNEVWTSNNFVVGKKQSCKYICKKCNCRIEVFKDN